MELKRITTKQAIVNKVMHGGMLAIEFPNITEDEYENQIPSEGNIINVGTEEEINAIVTHKALYPREEYRAISPILTGIIHVKILTTFIV